MNRLSLLTVSRLAFLTLILVILFTLTPPQPTAARGPARVTAHPLGNFSINRYSRLTVETGQIRLFYVLDMAEIPTFQHWPEMDTDGDGQISETENTAYLTALLPALQTHLYLTANGTALPLSTTTHSLTFPPGQGKLPTLRVEAEFVAALPTAQTWQVAYRDDNYADRLGWQEIIVQAAEGIQLLETNVPNTDLSQALRVYPTDLLQNPLKVTSAQFRFAPGAGNPAQTGANLPNASTLSENRFSPDRFAELITLDERNPVVLIGALSLAFVLGAAHALTPGHGKTIVGAYLVGSRGTAKHALFLGLTTTITHTTGVFLFGLLVLFASQFILPETLYPWLGVLSGVLVVGIGFSLLRERWQYLRGGGVSHHHHHHHDHAHPHPHHAHDHHDGHHHSHDDHHHEGHHHHHIPETLNWRSLLALGISGGLLPCPSALVLLLSAIALGRVGFGLILILAFSLGLAGVLTGIGLVLVYAGRLFDRLPGGGGGQLVRVLPVVSAVFIALAGLGITFQAILQTMQ
ncbi:MAG: hypothetical protein Fur0022_47030 [Anaerolineales bacterium]